ncbi:hypothetical protein SARC_04481 [Sphaeroforma arctica JP610]|uniref:Uncharacterized protein n=1 Tax=Sphaeroforma arctica JP610 TaxID=667725 RepID=A0A0L0G2G7_9EUKA|nr:hypothetical protein SARC_04481 [Sphaeroforma arctica JP610]KNC83265.1 hypothetical protein SARC_04481 [Sphaeroforma arctica JP610]|eukprot:XP_014157167.1 hypothetical protein SARC_04481 [Sphaeroforma arctica JP610]
MSVKARKDMKAAGLFTLAGARVQQSYADMKTLSRGEAIVKPVFSRSRFDEVALNNAISFVLAEEIVGTLSWGKKRVKLSEDETCILPSLTRKLPSNVIYDRYTATHLIEKQLSRGSFYRVLAALTSKDEKLLTAVDYVTGTLVNDVIVQLQVFINDFCIDISKKKHLTTHLELMKTFLKQQYDKHVELEDDCSTHGIKFALEQPTNDKSGCGQQKCNGCDFIEYMYSQLQSIVQFATTKPFSVREDASRNCAYTWATVYVSKINKMR